MTLDEATRLLNVTQFMLLGKDNQPISDLYYALQIAVDSIEELKERREADRWISVTERLPEQTTAYLVTIKFIEDYEECIMTDKVLYNIKYGWNTADEVIAWKPLPEPYKENDK